jgi:type 1 fimbriae regulatory protein FimB
MKYADAAGLGKLQIHPHMLRHACGYSLANLGADTRLIQYYLGDKNIAHSLVPGAKGEEVEMRSRRS